MRRSFKIVRAAVLVVSAAVVLMACTETRYTNLTDITDIEQLPLYVVGVNITPALFDERSDCTIVLPPKAVAGLDMIEPLVERTLGRHLSQKFARVIDGPKRRTVVRNYSLELRYPADRRDLAAITKCGTYLRTRIAGPGRTNLLVWSQVKIGLELTLIRVRDDRVLWRAMHRTDRSAGGVPFSPVGAIVHVISSASFTLDEDIVDSVVEDGIRRMVRALPDIRRFPRPVAGR